MFFQGVSAHGTLLASKCSYGMLWPGGGCSKFCLKSYSGFTSDIEASSVKGSVARGG